MKSKPFNFNPNQPLNIITITIINLNLLPRMTIKKMLLRESTLKLLPKLLPKMMQRLPKLLQINLLKKQRRRH